MWLLGGMGYVVATSEVPDPVQPESALIGLRCLMSWIPAAVAVIAMAVVYFYPLTAKRIGEINGELSVIRSKNGAMDA